MGENVLANFFYHLVNAQNAGNAVDNFDLDSENETNSEDFSRVMQDQSDMCEILINFVVKNEYALKDQLANLTNK